MMTVGPCADLIDAAIPLHSQRIRVEWPEESSAEASGAVVGPLVIAAINDALAIDGHDAIGSQGPQRKLLA